MKRNAIVGFRASEKEAAKLEALSMQTGKTVSQILRELVQAAEVELAVVARGRVQKELA